MKLFEYPNVHTGVPVKRKHSPCCDSSGGSRGFPSRLVAFWYSVDGPGSNSVPERVLKHVSEPV